MHENNLANVLFILASVGWWFWYPGSFYKMIKTQDSSNQSIFSWVSYIISDFLAGTAGLLWGQLTVCISLYAHFLCNIIYLLLVLKFKKKIIKIV